MSNINYKFNNYFDIKTNSSIYYFLFYLLSFVIISKLINIITTNIQKNYDIIKIIYDFEFNDNNIILLINTNFMNYIELISTYINDIYNVLNKKIPDIDPLKINTFVPPQLELSEHLKKDFDELELPAPSENDFEKSLLQQLLLIVPKQ
jgi:hypothetical protein